MAVEHTHVTIVFLSVCQLWGSRSGLRWDSSFLSLFSGILYALSAQGLGARAVGRISFSHVFTPIFRADLTRGAHTAFCTLALDKHPDPGRSALTGAGSTTVETAESRQRSRHELMWGVLMPVHSGNGRSAVGHWRATRPAGLADSPSLTVSHGIAKNHPCPIFWPLRLSPG